MSIGSLQFAIFYPTFYFFNGISTNVFYKSNDLLLIILFEERGFASPPDWLKAYDCLSQGEKMCVDIARALCVDRNLVVFDEFTSVVDREIAKVSAFAISKAVRRSAKKFIAVTCHYDVVDWLDPDWVFSTNTMEFSRKKESGRPLNSKSIDAALPFGRCFGNIII